MLEGAGYGRMPHPTEVAGIPFEFSAVVVATSGLDLIVVIDTIAESDEADIRLRVEGLTRALDLVDSRRPLTVILVGPEPMPELQLALTRVARVLTAGVSNEERALRRGIAVLLPLEVQTVTEMPESWQTARQQLVRTFPRGAEVVQASKLGPDAVVDAMRAYLLEDDSDDGGTP
jgi:hypothetical protein